MILADARARVPEIVTIVFGVALWATRSMESPILAADASSYASIAEHWADGRWADAVNGYWSPLYSWLVLPFHAAGVSHGTAFTVIGLAVSLLAIDRTRVLCRRVLSESADESGAADRPVDPAHIVIELLLLGSVAFHLFVAFNSRHPDHLMAALSLGALAALVDPSSTAVQRALRFGLWAAAASLAKIFALPFLLAAAVIWLAVRALAFGSVRVGAVDVVVGVTVLMAIVGAWSVALSIVYGQPTLTRAATYNAQVTAPFAQGNPFGWAGLLEPTHADAVSAWEDPSSIRRADGQLVDLGEPAPDLVDPDAVGGRVARFLDNVRAAVRATALLGGTAVTAVLAAVPVAVVAARHLPRRRGTRPAATDAADSHTHPAEVGRIDGDHVALFLAASAVAYVVGISLATVESRYLWTPLLLTIPVAAWAVLAVGDRVAKPAVMVAVAGMIAAASSARAAVELVQLPEQVERLDESFGWVGDTVRAFDEPPRVAALARSLLYIGVCLENGCTYWGTPVAESGDPLVDELRAADIDLLVVDAASADALGRVDLDAAVVLAGRGDVSIIDVRPATVGGGR